MAEDGSQRMRVWNEPIRTFSDIRKLGTFDLLRLLPGGFGWVLAAFAAIFWYLAYRNVIAPIPGYRNPQPWIFWLQFSFINFVLVAFSVVKWRQRKYEKAHPKPKDFGM